MAGRGLGGAGEGSRRREFEESYRQIERQEPAVSLDTANQWQQGKLFIGAGCRHGNRRSLWSGYLMPVPGPLALREAPSGWGATSGATGALELGTESHRVGKNFFQNLPLAWAVL